MSSIRPLVTITILVIVGVFLYTKINDGPAQLAPGANDAFDGAPPADVPPLASADASGSAGGATALVPAPAWSGNAPAGDAAPQWTGDSAEGAAGGPPPFVSSPGSAPSADPAGGVATAPGAVDSAPAFGSTSLPAVPAIPELPPSSDTATSPAASWANPPTALPANVPMAQYPGEASTPASPAATSDGAGGSGVTNETNSAAAVWPQQSAAPVAAGDERYGPIAAEPAASGDDSFAATWPAIQAALARQELAQAHLMLSGWYGSPTLSPGEAQQVESLLSQLAGTVVYSTEHRLEPAYVVHPGDTLQSIAQQFEVPWQLLAKINGVPAADLVQPGQELKVVRGPFHAVVELGKNQLTLMVDGRYAGRFPVTEEAAAAVSEGQWVVEQKLVNPHVAPQGVIGTSYTETTGTVDRVLVLRSESPAGGSAAISITSGPASPSGPTAIAPAAVRLSPQDAEELADILSVGSRVTIRR